MLKSKDSFSIEQLSKVVLALAMNSRQIPDNMWKEVLTSVLSKIEKAGATDTYYICMALGRWVINP